MRLLKYIISAIIGLLLLFTVNAQQVNTLYFLENVPVRHSFNPAIQPLSSFYLSLPVIGNTQFNFGNNSFMASSLNLSKADLFASIKPTTLLNADVDINLLGFGFRTHRSYWNFTLTSKSTVNLTIPKDMLKLGIFGNVNVVDGVAQLDNNRYDLSNFGVHANSYLEAALGYSKQIDEKWSYGIKLKYLHGLGAANLQFDSFLYNAGITKWELNSSISANSDIPDLENLTVNSLIKPAGVGGAADLGVTYRPNDKLFFGAAVTNLGMLKWSKTPVNYAATIDYTLNNIADFNFNEILAGINSNKITSDLVEGFVDSLKIKETTNPFSTFLSPKVNLSGEYGFLNNTMSVGLLSSTTVYNKSLFFSVTPSLNIHPINWLNLSLSYSLLNGRGANIGAGLGLRLGFINAFVTADYIPLNSAPLSTPLSVSVPVLGNFNLAKVPAKTDRLNVAIGFNFVFGNKQDADNDGISNRRDKCPNTPHGVIVDKKGCPLDTDGDSIPDYYDKCPDTPKEAYSSIDADGCPLDTDGDGVFDYLDKCPDTPYQAYKTVDKSGCPIDTDKDSVPDYLDKCPTTPVAEREYVDSVGCTMFEIVPIIIDSVYDEILIDSTAVLKNSNRAGKVANTKNNSIINPNNDIYPNTDSIPKTNTNPNVGSITKTNINPTIKIDSKIDNNPKIDTNTDTDTDGDGIIDRLDRCPQLAGVASNGGCPEIKKEVRVIFQKALLGIQFESAKYIIKPLSYVILEHVARVLNENTNYLVEIQGHTDNLGDPAQNQTLSENRANAVREYLISKGIDAKRLTSNGYGQMRPVADNTTSEGRAKNRRVEFIVSFE